MGLLDFNIPVKKHKNCNKMSKMQLFLKSCDNFLDTIFSYIMVIENVKMGDFL